MARLVTQFTKAQGQELLAEIREGMDIDSLKQEAETSSKKARRWRQVRALLVIAGEKGVGYLEELLRNPNYTSFAIDENGFLHGKRPGGQIRRF